MKKFVGLLLTLILVLGVCGCSSVSENNDNKDGVNKGEAEKKEYINAMLNEKIIIDDIAEITFTNVSNVEEILPPDTSSVYSYYQDNSGEKYIVLKGEFKNLLTNTFDEYDNFSGLLKLNDKYEYSGVVISFANTDDNDFYSTPSSLQTMTCYIWISVPDEVISDTSNIFDFYLDFINGSITKTVKFSFQF